MERVLAIEDDPAVRTTLWLVLRHSGFDARTYDSAGALLAEPGDLTGCVLTDIRMPGMDGFEAVRRIRALEAAGELAPAPHPPRLWSRLPILAATAGAVSGDRERCLAAGFDDHLRKPLTVERVHAALRTWIGAARTAPTARATPRAVATAR